jgi:DNA transposition AAA+ family ATPase
MDLILHNKQVIAEEVARLSKKTSQNRVAYMARVSNATISKIISRKWKEISNEMWRKVQSNLRIDFKWNHAETTNFKILYNLCVTAQQNSLSIAVSEDAGKGKTQTYAFMERYNNNVVYIECKNYWTKKQYIATLLSSVGLSTLGTTNVMIDRFIRHMTGVSRPLIIIDQFDKLKDNQLDLFMDFYNDLSHNCGFVLSGVKALEKRILNGVNKDRIGFSEIYSRIGRKFIHLNPITQNDVKLICNANGVTDAEYIYYVFNNCEQDLRRVRRDVEKYHLQTLQNKEVEFEEIKPTKKELAKYPQSKVEDEKYKIPIRILRAVLKANILCTQTDKENVELVTSIYPATRLKEEEILDIINMFFKDQETITA